MPRDNLALTDTIARRLQADCGLDPTALARARNLSDSENLRFDTAVLRLGLLEEDPLLRLLADCIGQTFIAAADGLALDEARAETLTPAYMSAKVVAPVRQADGRHLILTAAPTDLDLARELQFLLDDTPEFATATPRVIRQILAQADSAPEPTDTPSEERRADDLEILRRAEADGPVIRFTGALFDEAVAIGASDIHVESQEDGLRIRLRVNGILRPYPVAPSLNPSAVLARMKVLSGMNVSERRLPQDGRISQTIAGRKVDFRVSAIPTSFGESIVARVLDPRALLLGWKKLGFDAETTRQITEIIEQPSGLFLVTGPTGSGKTTTLYTALAHLNDAKRKILTVEDPIEYNLAGIEQVQVHDAIGMTLARAVRAFLRQDPDVLMIGEIRDAETAQIACRAALVGRMVLSTLHTNSPEAAETRLVDLGVERFIVREVLRGVLGQRLEITRDGSNFRRSLTRKLQI